MKKKPLKIAVIIAAVLAILLLSAQILILLVKQGKLNPVTVNIQGVDIHVKQDSLDMAFILSVDNPRYTIFQLRKLSYTVNMDTVIIAQGEKKFESEEAGIDTNISMPLTIYLDKTRDYLNSANNDESTDSTLLKISFEIAADIFGLGFQEIPISIDKTIHTPIPPRFDIERIEKIDLSLKDLKLRIKGKIINENTWNLSLINTTANIDIENLITGNLTMQDTIAIKAKSTTPFTAQVDVDDLQLVRDAFKAIFKVKDFPYTVTGQTYMAIDSSSNTIKVTIFNSGKIPIQPLRMRN